MKIHPITTPAIIPAITTHPKFNTAFHQMNCPVATAINANRKIIKEVVSFNRLSPSSTDDMRFGIFTNFMISVTLTPSGGETIPPNKNPSANVNPGIKKLATSATESAVKKTTPNAKLPMTRLQRHSAFEEIVHAASYNNGG